MAGVRCEVLRREGDRLLPCEVRMEDGQILRLSTTRSTDTARWLGTLAGQSVWADRLPDSDAPGTGEILGIEPSTTDEVGVAFGPDEEGTGGLFDRSLSGTLTGEHTDHQDVRPSLQRTSVLAWIAAEGLGEERPADVTAVPAPCEPLKRLIADEPLDPVPALDGGPQVLASTRARLPWRAEPRRLSESEHEDTATQITAIPGFALTDPRAGTDPRDGTDPRERSDAPDSRRADPEPPNPEPPSAAPTPRMSTRALAFAVAGAIVVVSGTLLAYFFARFFPV